VLEARVRRAGVHQERMAELPDVAKPLEGRRVDHLHRQRLELDVLPQRIAYDYCFQAFGPELRTESDTPSAYFSKFFWNRPASFLACAS